jgi:hypothetical protein
MKAQRIAEELRKDWRKRMVENERVKRERESTGARGVYKDRLPLGHQTGKRQREPFLAQKGKEI